MPRSSSSCRKRYSHFRHVRRSTTLRTARRRLSLHNQSAVQRRFMRWSLLTIAFWKRIQASRNHLLPAYSFSLLRTKALLLDLRLLRKEAEVVRSIVFDNVFSSMSNSRCLQLFRFEKRDTPRIGAAIDCAVGRSNTSSTRKRVSRSLATCVLLWRFATPAS